MKLLNESITFAPTLSEPLKGNTIFKCTPTAICAMYHHPRLVILESRSSRVFLVETVSDLTSLTNQKNLIVLEQFTVSSGDVRNMTIDPRDDSFYVLTSNLLIKYSCEGVYLGKIGKKLSMKNPTGLTMDADGNIYICDYDEGHIMVINEAQDVLRIIPIGKPCEICVDLPHSRLIVSDHGKDVIRILTLNGEKIKKIGSKGNAKGQFIKPIGVFADAIGQILVCDNGNDRVQMFNEKGMFICSIGGMGRTETQFIGPKSVTVDVYGTLFVGDVMNTRIQAFASSKQ